MDPSSVNEGATSDPAAAYAATTYQPAVVVSGAPPTAFPPGSQGAPVYPAIPGPLADDQQIAFQQLQQVQQQQQQRLQAFWAEQMVEVEQITDLKLHSLPLARIKKIMKADEDVRMIAGEAPAVFAKACEMFILELTMRAWLHAEEKKRKTLQKNDIAAAVTRTDIFDFLLDVMPRDEGKEDEMGRMQTMVPPYIPGMIVPFGAYGNQQQPVAFGWPQLEHQQQTSDDGQDEPV